MTRPNLSIMDGFLDPGLRAKPEKQAREQPDQRWRAAFENSAIGVIMADFTGRYFAANRAFLNMLGYTEPELYRLTFLDITHEDDRKANQELVTELVKGQRQHFEIEKRYRRKDGTLVWVRTNVARVPGEQCWFAVVEEITQRKHVEEELRLQVEVVRANERGLRELTETIPQMLWSAAADGGVDYCNQRALDYTGLSLEQVRGAGWMKAVHRDDIEKMAQAWMAAISTEEPFQYEFRCLHSADHTYRWCISRALPLRDQKGRIIKWFGSVVDLHDWKEAQQALQIAQAELARVSRLTTMGELAASIAHEVNQPLSAVTNNSSACLRLLADRNLGSEVLRRALEEIVAAGTRASAVIARIRAFTRKAPAERNELDVNEVIQEVLALTGHQLHENHVLLERQLTNPLPLVLGDRVQLQQVLLNLIMNGVEAMAGVTDRPRLLCVQSRVGEPGNVLVAVSDWGTGLGLPADRVFTPFFTTKANGMGMGLPISRSLVEGHGGRLWATPNSPHGAVFSFTLPVAAGNLS